MPALELFGDMYVRVVSEIGTLSEFEMFETKDLKKNSNFDIGFIP